MCMELKMFTVKVEAIGHGMNWNRYPVKFEFTVNGKVSDYSNFELHNRVRRETQRKSACDHVTIQKVSYSVND